MDPKKAAIVLILVYTGALLWILPPLEELRWKDPVAAAEKSVLSSEEAAATTASEELERGAETSPLPHAVLILSGANQGTVRIQPGSDKRADLRRFNGWVRAVAQDDAAQQLFGEVGRALAKEGTLSVQVPPGLTLRVTWEHDGARDTFDVPALDADGEHPLALAKKGPQKEPQNGKKKTPQEGKRKSATAAAPPKGKAGSSKKPKPVAAASQPEDPAARAPSKRGRKVPKNEAAAPGAAKEPPAGDRQERRPTSVDGHLAVHVTQPPGASVPSGARVRISAVSRDPSLASRITDWAQGADHTAREVQAYSSSGAPVDADGRVELAVPAGIALRVECLLGDSPEPVWTSRLDAFQRATERMLSIELPETTLQSVRGRVLSATDQRALAGVELRSAGELVAVTDAEGWFDLAFEREQTLGLELAGFEPIAVEIGPATPSADWTLELQPTGAREASSTVEPGQPAEPGRGAAATSTEAPSRLAGRVVDQTGAGVAGLTIRAVEPWGAADRHPRRLRSEDRVVAETKTDEGGTFAFAQLPQGDWIVGVAPAPGPGLEDVSGYAQPVSVGPAGTDTDLLFEVGRGLRLAGHLLDAQGAPIGRTALSLTADGVSGSVWSRTSDDGSFEFSPVGPRAFRVTVHVAGQSERTFGPLHASNEILELTLDPTTRISGNVTAQGRRIDGESRLTVLRPYTRPPIAVLSRTVSKGDFELSALEAGVYGLVVTGPDATIAISSDIDLLTDPVVDGLQLELQAGGLLHVNVLGASRRSIVSAAIAGRAFAVESIGPGERWSVVVPSTEVEVSVLASDGVKVQQDSAHVAPGGEQMLTFEFED